MLQLRSHAHRAPLEFRLGFSRRLRLRGLAASPAVHAAALERTFGRADSAPSRAGRGGPSRPGQRGGLDRRRMALSQRAMGVGARTVGDGPARSLLFAVGGRASSRRRDLLRSGRVARQERQGRRRPSVACRRVRLGGCGRGRRRGDSVDGPDVEARNGVGGFAGGAPRACRRGRAGSLRITPREARARRARTGSRSRRRPSRETPRGSRTRWGRGRVASGHKPAHPRCRPFRSRPGERP